MTQHSSLVVLVLLLVGLAGCTTGDKTPTTTASSPHASQTFKQDFDALAVGSKPAGWDVFEGAWGAVENASDSAHPKVMRGAGADPPGLSSLVASGGAMRDLELYVKFKMATGDAGAGVVFHWQDEQNYQIIRYSIRENDWHLFTMVDGNRQKQDEASVGGTGYPHADLGQWVNLRVRSAGGHVEAFQDEVKVIAYDLPAPAAADGRMGLFVRGDMTADFDDLEVET